MTHINVKISKAVATAEKDGIITAGMVGVPVSFMFDSWWDGLIVTAVFKGSGAPISVPLLGATETVVPWEVLKRPSTLLRIGAEGRLPDGTLVIPTTWATVDIVMSGANATDDLAKPPTPTAFDRIMSQIGNMNDLATEDKSSLVAAVNEAMEKGDGVDVSDASVGQIIKVAAVDDAGKPTAWEPADLPKHAQSDWDQNDESQADFVKNRPFYEKIDSVTLMPETQFSNLTHLYSPEILTPADVNGEFIRDFTISSDGKMIINTGDTVKVTFDGTVYECVRQGKWIGNQSLTSYAGKEDTGEPFLFSLETIPSFHTKSTDCVVKVEADISQIKKIDSKFLELPIAPGSGTNSTIENCTANYDYYTKNTANGKYSHAEGASNSADGECSHAEGYQCSASKDYSHAEGCGNKATGYYSHAEGGFGEASGYHAHSEGEFTKAIGDDSHSEGKRTIAKGKYQHVQGRYNVEDPTTVGTYAHIVGNGTDVDKRSNAHTLDWNGNAWFAGEVKVGGTGQYDYAAKTLAKTEDIPAVDSTLTQSGQAADAAVVGNRLSALSEEIVTTSESKVTAHNTGTDTHNDIRVLIQGLTDRLNALADSDDTTLDQLSEVVAYIKSNRSLIEAITTSKVSVVDIVDNLTTNVSNKPLSAAQGVALKALIDALTEAMPEDYTLPIASSSQLGGVQPVAKTDDMTQSVGVDESGGLWTAPGRGGGGGGEVDPEAVQKIVEDYIAANPPTVVETDPTVPEWAKQPTKPTYTAEEVGALPDTYTPPNQTAQQVGADPAGTAASAVSQHNTDATSHNDLRLALQELSDRINVVLDSDDTTLDQMSEVVAYIKSNKSMIEAITTSKVGVADIVNDLVTNAADKPLSAAQGVVIKTLIDALRNDKLDAAELTNAINTALAQAKESGEFDGADGKSAYQYAVEGGYAGTEAEFAAKLAQEIPEALPNPNALTFTGAVTGTYDGSAPLSVEIPSCGGVSGDSGWDLIAEITSDGAGTTSGLYCQIAFADYKELHIEAIGTADSGITFRLIFSAKTAWYDGQILTTTTAANPQMHTAHCWIIGEFIKVFAGTASGYNVDSTGFFVNNPRYAFATSNFAYIRFDANNSVVPEGATLKVWGLK